jgi:nicotinamidase-related amidase
MPPLATFCPPAQIVDKNRYSVFAEPGLIDHLRQREADALIVSGSETDVCVLATVLDAVDIGFRVVVVRHAVCSSSDEGHEMLMRLYHTPLQGAVRDRGRGGDPLPVGMTGVERHVVDICWRRHQRLET